MRPKSNKPASKAIGKLFPVRFEPEEEQFIRLLRDLTGLRMNLIILKAVHYALPRFLDGRINILTLQEEHDYPVNLESVDHLILQPNRTED